MKLLTLKQYRKMSKTALMRKITKTLRAMPKAKLALLCYNLTKAKLPRLSKKQITVAHEQRVSTLPMLTVKEMKRSDTYEDRMFKRMVKAGWFKRKTRSAAKRKFSPKQLAAQRLFAKRAKAGTLKRRRR